MIDILVLCLAGFAAGALNAVAGGGTFITFPALVWFGVPVVAANATATVTALPGYISSAWAFRHDMRAEGTLGIRAILAVAVVGAVVGAAFLILTPNGAFSALVPWLLLAATVLFAVGPMVTRTLRARGAAEAGPLISGAAILAVSIYGGYFNGGLGIMLLATFSLIGFADLNAMNGLKNVLSALLSIVSAAMFVIAGLIAWEAALPMAVASALGGYLGARGSKRVTNPAYLRAFVVSVGVVMTVLFFLR